MAAVGFDLGNTLVEYAGVPLNWEQHYPAALGELARSLGVEPTPEQLMGAGEILRRFNTRLHPREHEVSFADILGELRACFGSADDRDEFVCAQAFFRVFQQRLRPFADAAPVLAELRARGVRLGVFTDVPYGMPRELVLQDVAEAGLAGAIDVLLTSREAGCRKPAAAALRALAVALECDPTDLTYVGDERKDVEAARRIGGRAVLLDRANHRPDWGQDQTLASLRELLSPNARLSPRSGAS